MTDINELPKPTMELVQPDGSLTGWFESIVQSCLLTIWDAEVDFFLWALDISMRLGTKILNGLTSVLSFTDITQYINMMPPVVLNMLQLLGIPTAITMIMTTYATRVVLGMIPFIRLGA